MNKVPYPEWTKPKIQPSKVIRSTFFGEEETEDSKREREAWRINEVMRNTAIEWIDAINSGKSILK